MILSDFLSRILTVCIAYHGSVTSWLRTFDRNQAVGGHRNSLHLVGLAVDLVLDNPALMPLALAFAKRIGLYGVIEKDHLHLQAFPPQEGENGPQRDY